MKMSESDQFNLRFSAIIKKYRIQLNLSHEKLAELSQLTRTTISNVENCKKSPTVNTCYRIATGLGVSLSKLVKEAEEK